MRKLRSQSGIVIFILFGAVCTMLADVAWADVYMQGSPGQNRVRIRWKFPCSGPPPVVDQVVETTYGDPPDTPPPSCTAYVAEVAPDGPSSTVLASGNVSSTGEEAMFVQVHGCAEAGGDALQSTTSAPSAAVGSEAEPLRVQVVRTVVPGLVPDIVTLTLSGGGLQTFATAAGDQAFSTLKLIVYPDQAAADADADQLTGAGSLFFGAATLLGTSGSLVPVQGFSLADFLVHDDGGGQFTATPVTGLSKVVLVPDANTAVVSTVGDPQSAPSSTTGVPSPSIASRLWLAPAAPNPAHGPTRLRFAIPREGRVTLGIYDQQGRRVRQLFEGSAPAGEHDAVWDGRDATGRRAPSGLYIYRLDAEGSTLSGKVFSIR